MSATPGFAGLPEKDQPHGGTFSYAPYRRIVEIDRSLVDADAELRTMDATLARVYGAAVRDIVGRQVDVLGMFDDGTVHVPLTRWQRLRARLRNLWYDARHALCCGACREDSW